MRLHSDKCHYASHHCADCHSDKCHYASYHSADCHSDKCQLSVSWHSVIRFSDILLIVNH
jgi:hypothetical protein